MKHTVCQVATFEHAKCKYELYDYHILMHSGKYIYNETCAICCTSLYNFNSRRSDDIVTFVLENTWMGKSNCTHCANWHFSSHCSDEAQFTPSGHLLSPDSRQGRKARPLGIFKTHILSMCMTILSKVTFICLQTRCKDCLRDTGKCWIIWINSIVSCFDSLID